LNWRRGKKGRGEELVTVDEGWANTGFDLCR
jgi:hypothetical protein